MWAKLVATILESGLPIAFKAIGNYMESSAADAKTREAWATFLRTMLARPNEPAKLRGSYEDLLDRLNKADADKK